MKRVAKISLLVLLVLILVSALAFFSIRVLNVAAQASLLQNPGFEEGFRPINGEGELNVANGWNLWYDASGGKHRPEWQPEVKGQGASHVLDGNNAQKQFTTFSAHDAGLYQQIPTDPLSWYEFACNVWVWSNDTDALTSVKPGKLAAIVGINPWGDTRALYRTTLWGMESIGSNGYLAYDQWVRVSVTAQVWTNKIAVFTRAQAEFGVKHNDTYWDSCTFRKVDMGQGTPQPTYTPAPTYTPYPTPQPCPTCVPGPSDCVTLPQLQAELNRLRFVVEE